MNIIYFGETSTASTSFHRVNALKRLGHNVIVFNPYEQFSSMLKGRFTSLFQYRTGYRFLQSSVVKWIQAIISNREKVDLVWVDSGDLFAEGVLKQLKKLNVPIVLFNHDDPTGKRDGHRFDSLKKALPEYNLVTAARNQTEQELLNICNGKVFRIWMTYDEVAHSSLLSSEITPPFISDICFIGTWMRGEDRDLFLLTLIEKGLDVSIWGNRWQKSTYWTQLKPYWRGGALSGEDYVKAIQGAKVCIGMLSKGNRDLHTTRTMEVPFAGGLLCAERTTEHLHLYKENEEAIFWDDADECAEKCIDLLNSPKKREAIRLAGMQRVLANKVGNEDICRQILLEVSHL